MLKLPGCLSGRGRDVTHMVASRSAAQSKPLITGDRHGIPDKLLVAAIDKMDSLSRETFSKCKFNRGNSLIRRLSDRAIILEPKRKDKSSILGRGISKVAKLCYVLLKVGDEWTVTPQAFVKESAKAKKGLLPIVNPYLENLEHENLLIIPSTSNLPGAKRPEREAYIAPLSKGDFDSEKILSTLSPKEKLEACLEIMKGVEFLHSKGLMHGDLHAGNFFLFVENGKYLTKIADLDTVRPPQDEFDTPLVDLFQMASFLYKLLDPVRSELSQENQETLRESIEQMGDLSNPSAQKDAAHWVGVLESMVQKEP